LAVIRAGSLEQNEEENLKIVAGNKKLIFKRTSSSLHVALKYC